MPVIALAAVPGNDGPTQAELERFDDILRLQDTPAGFDAESWDNPYGYDKDVPFQMTEVNELMVYRNTYDQWPHDYYGNPENRVDWYEDYKVETNDSHKQMLDNFTDQGTYSGNIASSGGPVYSYTEAVSLDATGTGRRDHVAFVGFDGSNDSNDNVYLWLMDTTTGNYSPVCLVGEADWIGKEARNENYGGGLLDSSNDLNNMQQHKAANFFSITAGDYNGDGIETIIIYYPADNDSYTLREYAYGENGTLTQIGQSQMFLHQEYLNSKIGSQNASHYRNKLGVSLATGDFNRDRIDDLAVLSYMSRSGISGLTTDHYTPMLAVASGVREGGSILTQTPRIRPMSVTRITVPWRRPLWQPVILTVTAPMSWFWAGTRQPLTRVSQLITKTISSPAIPSTVAFCTICTWD